MPAIIVVLLLFMAGVAEGGGRVRSVRHRATLPAACGDVRGLAGVFRSTDGGLTFSGNTTAEAIDALFAIRSLEDPADTVVAASTRAIYDSLDKGCNWVRRYDIPLQLHHPIVITSASGGRAFIWSDEIFLRYERSEI